MGSAGAVLGVSADYHDAAAALVVDGVPVAAVEEERFSRVKHDPSMPVHSMGWCLEAAGLAPGDVESVVFYSKPLTSYERVLSTHAKVGLRGLPKLGRAVGAWSGSKLWVRARIERAMADLGHGCPPIAFAEHHMSHAASAFYPSPFESAAVLTFDGVGEWATSSIAHGSGSAIRIVEELRFPDSLGLFFSAMTAFCGFAVNDGEYKLMGLAPFGRPAYVDALRENVIDVAVDGSVRLDQRYFDYRAGSRMTSGRMASILDGPPAPVGREPGAREADIARSTQVVLEDALLSAAVHARNITGEPAACLAGGVALNCVANARLQESGPFDELWIQPAAGDSGAALGAALWGWYALGGRSRRAEPGVDAMSGALLGPSFTGDEIAAWLRSNRITHERVPTPRLHSSVATDLSNGALVGWFRGRAEFGPRALGHRSILADPTSPGTARLLNSAVKGREGFRPFAPSVLGEHAADWFCTDRPSPYMLFTAQVRSAQPSADSGSGPFADRLDAVVSDVPACTHVDGSARLHTVDRERDPDFHLLLQAFYDITGCPVLLNTSFNRAGEPIVGSPADALRCARAAGLDVVVLEDCVIRGHQALERVG